LVNWSYVGTPYVNVLTGVSHSRGLMNSTGLYDQPHGLMMILSDRSQDYWTHLAGPCYLTDCFVMYAYKL